MHPRSLDDPTLAARAANGDSDAYAELARRYAGLIRQATRHPAYGLTREELRQEALLGLFEACRAYEPGGRHRFGGVATVRVRHRVTEARKIAGRLKHRLLTEALGIDHPARGQQARSFSEQLASDREDPARIVELREELRELATRPLARRDRRLRAGS